MPITKKNRSVEIYDVTGTGASQVVKHYLGRTPSFVTITPTETGVTEACWTASSKTSVTLTITNNKTAKVMIER